MQILTYTAHFGSTLEWIDGYEEFNKNSWLIIEIKEMLFKLEYLVWIINSICIE